MTGGIGWNPEKFFTFEKNEVGIRKGLQDSFFVEKRA